MGYHAPDAEAVYEYIFRIGRHAPRGLSDGFGWSILFVNDSSSACQDFLARYGAELCYRTADRVRFVFFSGLTHEETDKLAREANDERGGRRRIGFLPRILQGRRRFEWERDPWQKYRPEALHPLDSRERIERHLDIECEINSAMPGAEEAFLLAQRIGIGRFVPCFLLFSDVGDPSVCLFPIAGKSSEYVFERLRGWIDGFYEINNPTLQHWAHIEKSVETATEALESTVYALSQWRDERLSDWKELQRVAYHQDRLEVSAPSLSLLDEIEADEGLTWEVRSLTGAFREQWHSIEQKIAFTHEVAMWAEKLTSIQTPQEVYSALLQFKERWGAKVPPSVRDSISTASMLFKASPPPLPPNEQVFAWWRSEHGRPLSRNQYDKYRSQWATYSRAKHGATAVGRAAAIRKEEFATVSKSALSAFVDSDPEKASNAIFDSLLQHLSVATEDPSWQQAVSNYRNVLVDYFVRLKTNVPPWVIQFGTELVPPLCWGECLPTIEQLQTSGRKQCLQHLPRLSAIVNRAEGEWDATAGAEQRKRLQKQRDAVVEICLKVKEGISAAKLLEADKLSIWLALASSLSGVRNDLEDRVFSRAKEVTSAAYPGRMHSRNDATHALRLLDDYDEAIGSLSMPFESDPDVFRVSLTCSLAQFSGKIRREAVVSPAATAKRGLIRATTQAEEAIGHWSSVKCEATHWSPSGRLYHVLKDTLTTERLEELQSGLGSDNHEAIAALTNRHEIVRLLGDLYLQELIAVENRICDEASRRGLTKSDTKQGIIHSVLVAIGLTRRSSSIDEDQTSADLLKKKASRGQFDVFLAHNSEDKAMVLRLGEKLRSRGIYPWIDVEQVPPGRWFQDILQSVIRTVKSAAIVIGQSGLGKWQAVEMRGFLSRCVEGGIPIIPVLLPGIAAVPDELVFLRELNHVRFETDIIEDAGIARLIWGITGERPLHDPEETLT